MNLVTQAKYISLLLTMIIFSSMAKADADSSCSSKKFNAWHDTIITEMEYYFRDHSRELANGQGVFLFEQMLNFTKGVIERTDGLIKATNNDRFKDLLLDMRKEYYVRHDLLKLGYAVEKARRENNYELFGAAAAGLYSKRFYPLAKPLLNRLAIEIRIEEIRRTKLDEEVRVSENLKNLYYTLYSPETRKINPEYIPCI